jgi:hypothetical protein
MSITYVVKRLHEVSDDQFCSVDPEYTVPMLAGLISAHNLGALNIEDECWFGKPEDYKFASKDAPALVRIYE